MEVYKIKITLNLERIQQTLGDKEFVKNIAARDLEEVLGKIPGAWASSGAATVSHLQEVEG